MARVSATGVQVQMALGIEPDEVVWRLPQAKGYPPREQWADGVWQYEPDKVVWREPGSGFPCMIVRNDMGGLCGYVGVPEGHPWHGQSEPPADVHGGITYANRCAGVVCHVPRDGEGEVWWLGFDCAHAGDLLPGKDALMRKLGMPIHRHWNEAYRDMRYVHAEVARLAAQADMVRNWDDAVGQ